MSQQIDDSHMLLSTTEAMEVSGFSREHLQRLLRSKKIKGIKPAHDWLVYEDSLKTFISQPRKRGPKPKHQMTRPSNIAPEKINEDDKLNKD